MRLCTFMMQSFIFIISRMYDFLFSWLFIPDSVDEKKDRWINSSYFYTWLCRGRSIVDYPQLVRQVKMSEQWDFLDSDVWGSNVPNVLLYPILLW